MNQSRHILTLKEVAEYLNIHTSTVYKYAQNGNIPSFKIGSDWRFTKKHIDQWIEERMTAQIYERERKKEQDGGRGGSHNKQDNRDQQDNQENL